MSQMTIANQSINKDISLCRLETREKILKRNEFFIIDGNTAMSDLNVFHLEKVEINSVQMINECRMMYIPIKPLSDKQIKDLLISFNFRFTVKGAEYVVEAIKLAYYDRNMLNPIKNLYKEVAKKYNKEYKNVQRSIIGTIDVMNHHITQNQLRSFFHIYTNDIVPPKYFFTTVIDYFYEQNN